jgi:hypothetical protein
MEPTGVTFTRYLYEYNQVKYSLLFALLEKCREEALFWAYELYHSGFKKQTWHLVRDIYVDYYEETHPSFKRKIDEWYLEWQESDDVCLLGTVVGTLSIMPLYKRNKTIIILYKEDRHRIKPVVDKPRNYLKQVSQYPIRSETKDLAKELGVSLEEIREAYLGMNWLYYCAETPLWKSRILEGGGKINVTNLCIEFGDDDLLEAFYERWGFEPDEQCAEMHRWHGVYL